MPTIDVDVDSIHWSARCCRCASSAFSYRRHVEKVVTSVLPGVTRYNEIEMSIPVCDPCSSAHWKWFGAAAVAGGIGLAIFLWAPSSPVSLTFILIGVAIVFAIVGTEKKPLRILKYSKKKNTLKMKIYDDGFAKEMLKLARGGRAPLK